MTRHTKNAEVIRSLYPYLDELEQAVGDGSILDAIFTRTAMLIRRIFGEHSVYGEWLNNVTFMVGSRANAESWKDSCFKLKSLVQVMEEELELFGVEETVSATKEKVNTNSRKVFVVHGHDNEMRLDVSLTLTQLDFEPIVLDKEPDNGRTLIEKFLDSTLDVGYAVVIMSPDDIGYPKQEESEKRTRARQNVILELGFFIGALGRDRVFVLRKQTSKSEPQFEEPSDVIGIVYKPYDSDWKNKLVRELRAAGYEVDANKLK